ncbi:MAG: DEAD/DEAH box helicase [Deltaproteobacteria bacterium]|nr:DEAD/DEAH box helicase [Deltaproteobacteria bacterium]
MSVSPEALRRLVGALKRRCPPPRWRDGETLSRGPVVTRRESDDEVVLELTVEGLGFTPTVVLYPEEGEWACDCGGSDPCAHVVAAALARDAAGAPLPGASLLQARVSYALEVTATGLTLQRSLVFPDGRRQSLAGPLASAAVPVAITEEDRALERWTERAQTLATTYDATALMTSLAACVDLTLDGAPVRASPEQCLPRATVEDHPDGFALRLERPPEVTATPCIGLCLCGAVLRPSGAWDLGGARMERLPRVTVYRREDAAALVLDALPALRARVPVVVHAPGLPAVDRCLRPRVDVAVTLLQGALSVLPRVVYGRPPCARVEGDRLVYLQGSLPARDRDAEVREAHHLRDALGLAVGVRSTFRGVDGARFLTRLRTFSEDSTDTSMLFVETALEPRLEVGDQGFDLSFEAPSEGSPARRAEASAVLQAWREGLAVVPLTDGGFAPLPEGWLRAHGHRVAALLGARREDGTVPRAALPSLAALCEHLEMPPPKALEGLGALLQGPGAVPVTALPEDLQGVLRPYQHRGVDWLAALREVGLGALLADDMGLGKTVQTLAALRGRSLVVCPRSVLHAWEDELRRFRPGLRVALYHGPGRALGDADVTLTTYAVLRLDADALAAEPWDCVVLDEAQAIKNPDSQAARSAYRLRGDFRVALSGTPVENRLEELWSVFHFLNPGLLGGRTDFDDAYARPLADGDPEARGRLREALKPFVLRRLKREVAPELPPRTEVVLRCALDDTERGVYDAVRAARRDDVARALGDGGDPLVALEVLLRLRQAACHAGLVPGQRADSSSKVECLVEALSTAVADGHRALVFSQWTSLLDKVEPHLTASGVAFARLDGSTRDREGVVKTFQSEEGAPVLLVSLKAGGTGLTLTAADHVFLLDPWWNPAVEDQAADRAHRIGQERPVTIYRLVAADTVEERIIALQARKRALAAAALTDDGVPQGLTRDDLRALLAEG